jgi:hypothetical protein
MSGHTTGNVSHLTRSQLWSTQLKTVLEDEMMGMGYVNWMTEFPDGDTFNIPSIGELEASNYLENTPVKYTSLDSGNFQFQVTDYLHSGTFITEKMKQDSYLSGQLMARFVPSMQRAIAKKIEVDIMALGPNAQTAGATNAINGIPHRRIGSGTNDVIAVKDFAYARLALQKANVPLTNLIAVVDPSVEMTLSTLSTLTDVSNNAKWEGIITTGMSTGMRFIRNIYGFDVYVSNYLKNGIAETIGGNSVADGVANLFFSATPGLTPFIGAMRQAPKVDSEYNKDLQRDEYVTTCRYGLAMYRPENFVTIITDAASAVA